MEKIGFLFDLDGVIVDTAKYHFLAWKSIADEIGAPFTKTDNERLRGVSRMESLEVVLEKYTGTLWEYKQHKGSYDHGFASYALVVMETALKHIST